MGNELRRQLRDLAMRGAVLLAQQVAEGQTEQYDEMIDYAIDGNQMGALVTMFTAVLDNAGPEELELVRELAGAYPYEALDRIERAGSGLARVSADGVTRELTDEPDAMPRIRGDELLLKPLEGDDPSVIGAVISINEAAAMMAAEVPVGDE